MVDDQPVKTSRRDRQIQRKRREIIEAATRLFSEKGYGGTTTRDIADAVDIGESTLYNYFENKRDILLAIITETGFLFDDVIGQVKRLDNRQALVELYEKAFNVFISRIAFTRTLLAQAWMDNEILESFVTYRLGHIAGLIQALIQKEIDEGVFRPIDPAQGARMAIGMFLGAMVPVLRGTEPPPTPAEYRRISEGIVTVLWDGIGNH